MIISFFTDKIVEVKPDNIQPSASPFDLGDMGSSLPPTQATAAPVEPEKKTAQSFLGSAAGLVNLDNLVQKPKEPAVTNPFGMSSAMTPQGTHDYPNNSSHFVIWFLLSNYSMITQLYCNLYSIILIRVFSLELSYLKI